MQELISKWQQFMIEWNANPQNHRQIDMTGEGKYTENRIFKPDFYDFMEWLSLTSN